MRVLVTGAAGFIGSALVDRLLTEGHVVTGIDDLSTGRLDNLDGAFPGPFSLAVCDVSGSELGEFVADARPEVVFHLAAQASVRRSIADPLHDARVNVLGTINLLQASQRAGARRVVYATSGCMIYGDPARLPVSEVEPADPLSPHAASKLSGELHLHASAGIYGLSSVSLALGNVYGPRQNPHGEAGVVSVFGTAMLTGRPTVIYGNGSATRDYVYVDDAVEALVRAAYKPRTRRRFNIGSGIGTTVTDLHRLMAETVGVPNRPKYREPRAGEVHAIVLGSSTARHELGWRPVVGLQEGIQRTVAWLRCVTDRDGAEPVESRPAFVSMN